MCKSGIIPFNAGFSLMSSCIGNESTGPSISCLYNEKHASDVMGTEETSVSTVELAEFSA